MTIMTMLHDRGYLVSQRELDMTLDQFRANFGDNPDRNELTILVSSKDDQQNQLFVFFPDEPKVGMNTVTKYAERMEAEAVSRAIVVVIAGMTPIAKRRMDAMRPKLIMEYFLEQELLVNITEHELVPLHTVLTEEEKKTLLARYTLRDSQLPRMQITDPVARYFGLARGQVVKIQRESETAGRYTTYRLVV